MKQKSEIRSQKSEIRSQKSERRNLLSVLCHLCSVFMLAILMFASGCATTGEIQRVGVITAIDIIDDKLNIAVDKPFTYTIYKSSDPYKVIVEVPDVRLGIAPNKIKLDKAGITEVTPFQIEEPLSTRIEILLSSPVSVEPIYKETALAIRVKEEPEATVAEEVVTVVPKAEEKVQKVQEVKAPEGKVEEPVKEVKWPEIAKPGEAVMPTEVVAAPKPEEKPVIPTEEVKEGIAAPKPELKVAVPKELPPATSIVGVNIEKEENFLKVIIKGNGSLSPDVFRLDNRAVLDIPNVEMAASLPVAMPLPLKSIRAGKHKDKTRLVLDMKEKTSFDVAAVEDSVIVSFRIPEKEKYVAKAAEGETKVVEVEAKAVVLAPEKPVEGKYKGQKISLDFQDAEIGPIFRLLADISGDNFVIDEAVKGKKITMKLMNVPWDQALDIILQTHSLGKSVEGNIIRIAPHTFFSKKNEDEIKAEKERQQALEKLAPLKKETYHLAYANAENVKNQLLGMKLTSILDTVTKERKTTYDYDEKQRLLSPRGTATADRTANVLVVTDIPDKIAQVNDFIKEIDQPTLQVMIEAKIVEVSSNYGETLGIKWGGVFQGGPDATGQGGIKGLGNEVSGSFAVNTPTAAVVGPGGVLGMTIGAANSVQVNLSLSALESIGKSKRLANPKILTMDNEKANIQQGTSIPVQTTSAEGTKTEYVNATLSLDVTPTIKVTPDGYRVQMKIKATNNSLGILTPQGYAIETKSVDTQAVVKNGETLVIGGIYTTNTTEGEEGIPLLSKIPFLGWLFKTKTQAGPNVTEMLIFITPMVVSQPL